MSLRKHGEILGCHGNKTQPTELILASPAALSIPHHSKGSWLCPPARCPSARHFTNICETSPKFLIGQACTLHLQFFFFFIFKGISYLLAHFNTIQVQEAHKSSTAGPTDWARQHGRIAEAGNLVSFHPGLHPNSTPLHWEALGKSPFSSNHYYLS